MKKKILIASVVLMALVISFCVIKKVCEERAIMNSKQEREEKYRELGAKEYLISEYGFEEAELEGYDLETFVQEWDLAYGEVSDSEEMHFFWDGNKHRYKLTENYRIYNFLSKKSDRKITQEDVIVKIGYEYGIGNAPSKIVVFDVEAGQYYYLWEETPRELTDSDMKSLAKIVKEYHIDEWESETEIEIKGSTGYTGWRLTFELADGSVCIYSGYAEDYTYFPDDIRRFRSSMERYMPEDEYEE